MPIHRVQGSDGNIHRVEAPADANPDYVVSIVENELSRLSSELEQQTASDEYMDAMLKDGPEQYSHLGNIGSGFRAGAAGLIESAALGGASLLDENTDCM